MGGGAAILAFGFLLYSLRGILNPGLLFLVIVIVAVPLRRTSVFWPLLGSAGGLTLFWVLAELGFLVAPFVLALVAAYVLNPLVDRTSRLSAFSRLDAGGDHRRSRSLAIVALALPLIAGFTGGLVWGIPAVLTELNAFVQRAPDLLERVAAALTALEGALGRLRFPGVEGSEWVARIRGLDEADLVQFLEERSAVLLQGTWEGVLGLGRGIGSLLSIIGYLVLTPVLAFYLMRDYRRLGSRLDGLIPPGRAGIRRFLQEYDGLLSAYLRGQITVALLVGSLTALGLWIAQFPYAFLLGVLVAVLGIVPYLGLLLSLLPAVAIALTTGAVWASLLKVAVVFGVVQALEGTLISPRVLGDSTGLHPVWIILAIALGGFFFGFVGLLIAVPVAAGVKLLAVRGVQTYRASAAFAEGQAGSGS